MTHSITTPASHTKPFSEQASLQATSRLSKDDIQQQKRGELTIIVLTEMNFFHFCGLGLEGVANEAWYPYSQGLLFEAVERYLVAAKVAQNVVSIDQPRRNGASIDYRVRFNVFSTDKKRVSVRFPVMIKNFGNDTQCLSLDELTRALSQNYRNKHVSIMWSLPSGIISTVYVSVAADGGISDCYTHHALWFVMEGGCIELATNTGAI
ncbi:hypothetical protein A1L58_22115 [Shewanella baltica]|uniref:hypothetical protein n=1 Tax=Shewanella baltica TaxID=62322 RepID=UPI0001883FC7|nr:hypothetical protein [Shewanella baltica]ACK48981.1 hypothetical protein Sbal223_4527 [Shewanella baltica OS223]KZK65535.1 hypothetical protein A1L58_22115 [Shewanella baltica]